MSKIKILYIGNKLLKHGISATSIETLGPLLEREGYDMFYSSDKKNILFRLLDMIWSIWRYRNEVNYVLIDTYSKKSFYGSVFISRFCKFLSLKNIMILRGGNLPYRLKKYPLLSGYVFKDAYRLISPSGYLKHEFEKRGYNAMLIPNNIDINIYKFRLRSEISPSLLYVRSFAAIYNPQMAIEVLRLLKKDYPSASLCMVGPDKDGTLLKCQELVKEYQLQNSVTFTGVLSKKEWHKLSEKYDIFINTTNVDNTPVSVIEA
ncbi:MAG: glycosyltransferase family 4 protein, partial [Chlorobi bacterium]|nr:glycosyltransferase family 4 protein [Chlorobiota bacterium]